MQIKFSKYYALGNDYIILNPEALDSKNQDMIRKICHRNYGTGSDGILLGPLQSTIFDFKLRIFNPDGGEAEKSDNGLRIFARYLWDEELVSHDPFTVETPGGTVSCEVLSDGRTVKVEMGRVSFNSIDIPVTGASREVLNEAN